VFCVHENIAKKSVQGNKLCKKLNVADDQSNNNNSLRKKKSSEKAFEKFIECEAE
jgi:hypothetical protein